MLNVGCAQCYLCLVSHSRQIMLSVTKLNVVMLSVIAPLVEQNQYAQCYLCLVSHTRQIMLRVSKLNVIMLSVIAPLVEQNKVCCFSRISSFYTGEIF
jgi:hypothetical protein